jgi:putative zinc finger/helix-turn-helix YgiT family protein
MKNASCSECGAEARLVRDDYLFKESGLRDLVVQGIELVRCPKCGNEDPIFHRIGSLVRAITRAVLRKPSRLTGEEVRFLRKHAKLSQDDFSRYLHVDKTTLSKWENSDDPVGAQSDLLIRLVIMALDKSLQHETESLVRSFDEIENKQKRVHLEVDAETLEAEYANR